MMLRSHRFLVAVVTAALSLRGASAADECATNANLNTCLNAGQLCVDPDPNVANNWECRCVSWLGYTDAMTVVQTAAAATTCTRVAACTAANAAVCTAQKQACVATPGGTAADFECKCIPPYNCANGVKAAAAPMNLDECSNVCETCADKGDGNGNTCTSNGQMCSDPSATTTGNWACNCPPGATKTSGGAQAVAVCTYAGGCAANFATCTAGQYCYDPTPSLGSSNTWGCMCLPPTTGPFKVGAATKCVLDECTASCPTCAGLACQKNGQSCTDSNTATTSLSDWTCSCAGSATGTALLGGPTTCTGTGACAAAGTCAIDKSCTDSSGTATCSCVAPLTGTTTCVFDECTVYSGSCTAPYKCKDLNTAATSLGDWVCAFDECYTVCPTCPRTTTNGPHKCFDAGQTCTDASTTTTGDWSCGCSGDATGTAVIGGVATCSTPSASECTSFGAMCTSAKQSCSDPDTTKTGDWTCNCLNSASTKTLGVAAVATCTLDECTASCPTCAGLGACPAGQTCVDPNKAETSTSDWYCTCTATGTSGMAVGRAATCVTDECITNQATCLAASQECYDPDTTVPNNWQCRCPHDISQTATVGTVATCNYPTAGDECSVTSRCTANEYCLDPSAVTANDWTCNCISPYAGTPATAALATCAQNMCGKCTGCADTGSGNVCALYGQTCVSAAGNWKCTCPTGQTGELINGVATCVIDECTANAATCGAQQCIDTNKNPSSTGDWYCVCPSGGPVAKAQAAVCTVDECVGNSACGADQTCSDPNQNIPNNWICICKSNSSVTATMKAATCPVDECAGNSACGAGQTCDDPNMLNPNDWMCVCDTDSTVTKTGGPASCPSKDECLNNNACPTGQSCQDPDTMVLNDWMCVCDIDSSINATLGPAVCSFDECVGNSICVNGQTCTDPNKNVVDDWRCYCVGGGYVVGAACVNECLTNTICSAASQICVDSDQTAPNNWGCRCNTPVDTTTFANLSVATCITAVDECSTSPCGTGQTCDDPVKKSNSLKDYVCSCTNGVNQTGGPANCNAVNECASSPCGTGQTCSDPSMTTSGDYVCTCSSATSIQGIGKPASPCGTYLDECFNCPNTGCPCGDNTTTQSCSDPSKLTSSTGNFVCTCTQTGVSTVGAAVSNCVGGTPVPSSGKRYFFSFKSNIQAAQFSQSRTVAAIVQTVNFIENTSTLDPAVVSCSGCSQVTASNVVTHCFATSCLSFSDYATTERDASVLQSGSQGVFEFVSTTGTTEVAKQTWLDNLQQSQPALMANPDIQLVSGSFVAGTLTPSPPSSSSSGLPWWVWLLIVLAILLCCCLIFALWWFFGRGDKEKKKQEEEEAQRTYASEMKEHHTNNGDRNEEEDPFKTNAGPGDGNENANGNANGNGHGNGRRGSDGRRGSGSDAMLSSRSQSEGGRNGQKGAEGDKRYSEGADHTGVNPINTVFPPGGQRHSVTPIPAATAPGAGRDRSTSGLVKETVLLGFGRNMEGQLGLGDADDLQVQYTPMEIPDFRGLGVSMLSCGSFHTYVVLLDATVMVFGEGGDGQLGLGNRLSPKIPTPVPFFKGKVPRIIACGEQHSIIVCNDNLYACGSGQDGQLGLGDVEDRMIPTAVPLFSGRGIDVDMVACGSHHTCVVYDGILYTMGWNRFGQLGLGDDIDRNEPTEVLFFRGKVIRDITCGVQHTVVLCTDGLYVMGGNTFGQLGLGHQMNQQEPQRLGFFDGKAIKSISAWFHTIVSCEDGVYVFGEAMHGKLGTDPFDGREEPPNVFSPRPIPFFASKDVIIALAGSEHSVLHCTDGIYIWGNSEGGKLGHGHTEPIYDPSVSKLQHLHSYSPHLVAIGVDHTLVYASQR